MDSVSASLSLAVCMKPVWTVLSWQMAMLGFGPEPSTEQVAGGKACSPQRAGYSRQGEQHIRTFLLIILFTY